MARLLEDHEDFIRKKVVDDKWTHKQINSFLSAKYPGARGISLTSIQRFCKEKEIHKTPRISDGQLQTLVSEAISMVSVKKRKLDDM